MHVSLRIPDIKIWICSKGIVAMHLRQLKTLCLQLRPELGRVGVNLEIKKLRYHFKTVLRQKTRYDTWTLNDLRYAADSNSKKSAKDWKIAHKETLVPDWSSSENLNWNWKGKLTLRDSFVLRTEVKFNLFRCLSRQRFFASLTELHYGHAHWISENLSSYHHMNRVYCFLSLS